MIRAGTRLAVLFAWAALSTVPPAGAQQTARIRRGDIEHRVKTFGTVLAVDLFRLRSTIEGRAEDVWTSTGVWARSGESLGFLVNREFAALIDSPGSTRKGIMADRWNPVYQPSHLRCPDDCFVLKLFAKSKQWVKPQAVLVEAAGHLRMVGRVRPEEAHFVRDGMTLTYWTKENPKKRFQTKIAQYRLDIQGEKAEPGGSFALDHALGPDHSLLPGTEWEGTILVRERKGALIAPTEALIRYNREVFLPMRVSTGITTPDWTEITAGAEEKRPILILDDSRLRAATRHRVLREEDPGPAQGQPATGPEESAPQDTYVPAARPRSGPIRALRDPDAPPGEDPYSE